ncbi:condensation domain-containing protein [Mycobacteroides abscessus]|uniref:condensation domain-containing protein n=1 Tax=Mycobacteroides abscessus TaxID=36809 RepID=UPI000C2615DA|nr:condensation domain-containing protein [Mycobacteroides abscessus]
MLARTVLDLLAKKAIDREAARVLLESAKQQREKIVPTLTDRRVAIIGLAAQLPGAASFDDFWNVLERGEDCITQLPLHRRILADPFATASGNILNIDGADPYWQAAWISDVDKFDAAFFGITPAEARSMDPQQRRFLQVAYHCLEDAGYAGDRTRGSRTGVYVSAADSGYLDAIGDLTPMGVPGNVSSFVASRLSFWYDLRGPAYTVSATCASSLLAVHDACTGLFAGDCDRALVGGVTIFPFPLNAGPWLMSAAGIVSDEQRCKPFDDTAAGIGRGEGVVAVLLKPYEAAVRDRDRIHGVILGSAVNNDGAGAALTAPNPAAHTELLLEAWGRAGISPETLGYLEAHGTGTKLGDPIEIKGITDAVRRTTKKRQFIALGSVKGNIGHLVDGTAGLSGLVKALLVLKHGKVPPTAGLTEPNRQIDFLDSPGFVPTKKWQLRSAAGEPVRAGVSCFGFNGTNVHVVLESYPPAQVDEPAKPQPVLLFPFSALDEQALRALLEGYARWEPQLETSLADVSYTLCVGREHLPARVVVAADSLSALRVTCDTLAVVPRDQWKGMPNVFIDASDVDNSMIIPASAYLNGGSPDWSKHFTVGTSRIVDLPKYPFQESSFWVPFNDKPAQFNSPTQGVLEIVKDVLGLPELAISDSFLAVGGTSLSGMQLVGRLRKEFGWQVDLEDLLLQPDFAELVRHCSARQASQDGESMDGSPIRNSRVLSHAQRRFWLLDQLEAQRSHYHVPMLLNLQGELDVIALEDAIRAVVRRHDILRSSYPIDQDGLPDVQIRSECTFSLEVVDLSVDSAGVDALREQALTEAIERAYTEPFNLETGPMWRARLIKRANAVHVLVVVMHHMVSDMWSLAVFNNDLWAEYSAALKGGEVAMGKLSIQYPEFAAEQQRQFTGARLERLTDYWKGTLCSLGERVELGADRPRPASRTLHGKTILVRFPNGLGSRISRLCAQAKVTPFMVFLAAFYALLYRSTGESDLLIGTEVANRIAPEAEPLIGPFVNQLPLRVKLSGDLTVNELLARVRHTATGAFAHQDMPFDKLVEVINPIRSAATTPLFGIKLLFNTVTVEQRQVGELIVEPADMEINTSPFDVTLRVFEVNGGYDGSLTYSTDLFDAVTINNFVDDYREVLATILDRQTERIGNLLEKVDMATSAPIVQPILPVRRATRRSVAGVATELIGTRMPSDSDRFPLVIEPKVSAVDLVDWIRANHDFVYSKVAEYGAVLFRGFGISSVDQFHKLATAVHPELVEYSEPSTPRGEYKEKIYVSSEYPNWYSIPLHGELAYTYRWPMKALFYAKKVATSGGETPIADAREVLLNITPKLRDKFREKHVMYVRNFGGGMLVPWQKVFATADPGEVERHCMENSPMHVEWLDGGRLRTRQIRPATAIHPITGEEVWFNQAHIFHAYSLGNEMQNKLYEEFGVEGLPVHALYGDGTPIANSEMDEIYHAYEVCKWAEPWQQGDVLLADNMLMAHGRHPFEGERETVVAFVEPCPPEAVRRL